MAGLKWEKATIRDKLNHPSPVEQPRKVRPTAPPKPATAKQISYLRHLLLKHGVKGTKPQTMREASSMIDKMHNPTIRAYLVEKGLRLTPGGRVDR